MMVTILLETDDYLVINKPAGLLVHEDGRNEAPTLTDWIREHYPTLKGVGEPVRWNNETIDRPGIVHRLDEDTSGVLIVAKTPEAFSHFKKQFMDRTIEKEYHAFVWGHFKEKSGIVSVSIGRSPNDFRRRLAGRGVRGEAREAFTHWQVSSEFEDETGERFSFMKLFPKTGRTHQLRVHMKYLQRPIVCDHLYAPIKHDALGFKRLALHARSIRFCDLSGRSIEVQAPYPEDFERAVAKYTKA